MDASTLQRARRAGSTVAVALSSLMIGLAAPVSLHATADRAGPHTRAVATQPLPPPPNPAIPPPRVATTPAPPPTPAAADALELGRAFTEVANRVVPSVVSIRVTAEADSDDPLLPLLIPFLAPGADRHRLPLIQGAASGVVVRQDGIILTNYHVGCRTSPTTWRAR